MTVIVLIYFGFRFYIIFLRNVSNSYEYQGDKNVLLTSMDVGEENRRCFDFVSCLARQAGGARDWQRSILQVDRECKINVI